MKKILPLTLLAMVGFASSCSQSREWNQAQREEFLTTIDDYRQMVYLNDLDDMEYMLFANDVAGTVETNYPVYTTFVAMPSLSDSVDVWVVTTIVEDIDEDAHNIRHIYPYHTLVEEGVLPAELSDTERRAFYKCLAQKINNYFDTMEAFFYAIVSNTLKPDIITKMQNECASELFDWEVEIDTEVIETT